MKKLLNVSVFAALAILPFAANAEPVSGDPGATTANAAVATNPPKYALAEADANVDGVIATAGYVKGAYNAAIKAVNKLETTKQDALSSDQLTAISNVSGLDSRVGTLETTVGNSSSGLVKAVADNTTAIAGKQDSLSPAQLSAVNSGITADKVSGYDSVASAVNDATTGLATKASASDVTSLSTRVGTLETGAANYATKTGVETTVTNAFTGATANLSGLSVTNGGLTGSATASVPVMANWGDTSASNNPVSASVDLDGVNTAVVLNGNTTGAITSGTVAYPANQ